MQKIFAIPVITVLLAISMTSNAQNAPTCAASNYATLIKCLEQNSSEIKISTQRIESATKLEAAADEWLNPELDIDTLSKGSSKSESSATLFFNIRLGGKREARVNDARNETQLAQISREEDIQQFRLNSMLALYRLAHLKNEISIEEESIETFSKIINQFEKRAALSPEQNVSLSLFNMSIADHKLRVTQLKSEEDRIYSELTANTGLQKTQIQNNLPTKKETWPEVQSTSTTDSAPQIRKANAELNLARSKNEIAESEAWSDLKIGPSVRSTKDETATETFSGVGLSIPLPLFSRNNGMKSYTSQKIIEAEMQLNNTKQKSHALRESLAGKYNRTVQSLKDSPSVKAIDEKHENLEKQFFKGLVSSSLVIEAHRQLFELEERRNASELEALEALGHVFILDNKFNEVVL